MSLPTILAAADYFNVTVEEIAGKRRFKHIIPARAAITYVMKFRDELSYPEIGRRMGDRDHSTMMHLKDIACDLKMRDPEFAAFVDAQMALPKHSPRAAIIRTAAESPEPVVTLTLAPKPLPPCPPRLIKLRPPPKPAPRYEKVGTGSSAICIDEDGVSRGERHFHQGLARGSKALFAALLREHPERCGL